MTRGAARPLALSADDHDWYRAGEPEMRALKDFAAVIMRKDPPFDMEYVYSTYLLECAEREGARVFNRPRAIRDNNEKMAITKFAEFIAPTIVTRDATLIDAFIDEHRDVIVKPLDGMGGVVDLPRRRDDPNRNVIVETVSHHGAQTVMVQRFMPEIVDGDKRVLLIAGEGRSVRARAHSEAGRDARQPGGRRPRRSPAPDRARARNRARRWGRSCGRKACWSSAWTSSDRA